MHRKLCLALVAAFALTLGVAQAQTKMPLPPGVKITTTGTGSIFTDANGMTLYTFDKDMMDGKSVCNGPCATLWPPVAAGDAAKPVGAFTVITRDDGSKQWAYAGKPLYAFARDKAPGDMTGDGFAKGVWHVAMPAGAAPAAPKPAATM